VNSSHSESDTPEPNASHEYPGCWRRGARDRPAADPPHRLGRVAPAIHRGQRFAERVTGDDDEESEQREQAGRQRHQQRPTVLPHGGPVAFDAVNTVGPALDLTHRGGQRDNRSEQAEPQRELAASRALVAAVLCGFLHHVAVVAAR
jgi:hypothetical protein